MKKWLKEVYEGEHHQKLALAYDLFMCVVIIVAIGITFASFVYGDALFDNPWIMGIDIGAIVLFNIDYWGGMILCDDKKAYFKRNLFDLASLIPLNQVFIVFKGIKLLRLFKLLQLVRVFGSVLSIRDEVEKFCRLNGFIYMVVTTMMLVGVGSVTIYFAERGKTIENFADAIWWTIVTTTTVGYGDISPQTALGRVVAVILMLVGIGFIGMLTGNITTYFTTKIQKEHDEQREARMEERLERLPTVTHLGHGETIDLSDLTREQYKQVITFIQFLKAQNQIITDTQQEKANTNE